jgi:predicted dehydrogenase
MALEPMRVALVGAGAMGGIIARDIVRTLEETVRVVAVVDRDEERAAALAHPLDARAYTSLADAAAAEELEGADLRLPHTAHRAAVLEALGLGLHVLVEKPLAIEPADLAAIRDAAAGASDPGLGGRDLVVAVAENYPHVRAVRAAADAIADGRIGEVLAVRTTRPYTLGGVWAESGWRLDGGAASGVLWDQGTHHASLIRTLAGPIASVAATATSGVSAPGTETVLLQLALESGVAAQSLYCWGTPALPVEAEAVVFGTEGRIDIGVDYLDSAGSAVLVPRGGPARRISEPEGYYESHGWILEDWVAAARGGGHPLVGVDDAIVDARVVLAALASLDAGGTPVPVDAIGVAA